MKLSYLVFFIEIFVTWSELILTNKNKDLNDILTEKNNNNISRRKPRNAFFSKQSSNEKYAIRSDEKPATNHSTNLLTRPKIKFSQSLSIPIKAENFRCFDKDDLECQTKTKNFRNKVLEEFQKNINASNASNSYKIEYENSFKNSICSLSKPIIRTLNPDELKQHELSQILPKQKMFEKKFKSCVIVSSAGSLLHSNFGDFIGKQF